MHRKAVFALLVFAFSAEAGQFNGNCQLQGEVTADGPVRLQELSIELQSAGGLLEHTSVAPDGRFHFPNLVEGGYRLRVVNLRGATIREDVIQVNHYGAPLAIHLRGNQASRGEGSGSVSVRRLAHKPPKAAKRMWKRAGLAVEKGEHLKAIAYLEQTIAIDPDYFEAYYVLGSERVRAGNIEGALTAFDKALEIDPSSAASLVNRGIVLLHLRRVQEAAETARKALLFGGNESAHYVLGLSLAVQGRDLREAVEHLKQSENRHPQARATVQQIEAHLKNGLVASKE